MRFWAGFEYYSGEIQGFDAADGACSVPTLCRESQYLEL